MRVTTAEAKNLLSVKAYSTFAETDYVIYAEETVESPDITYTVTDNTGMVIMTEASLNQVNYLFENWDECL